MRLLASLDRRDRRLLAVTAVLALSTIVLIALVRPEEQRDTYIPSTDSTAPHGAKAAYELLERLGYRVERSEGPLAAVAAQADAHTVLILAEPVRSTDDKESAAIRQVLARGGRVLATGILGADALPENDLDRNDPVQIIGGLCDADPVGFSPLTAGGKVVIREIGFAWKADRPEQQAAYTCAGRAVVVSYAIDHGTVVWWTSASPLENQNIAGKGSLELLLASLRLAPGDRIVWDESLHAEPAGRWDPAHDRILIALLAQLFLVALLLVLARGRRSGPLRPLPAPARGSPMEFVRSLGGLYRASGANDVPVTIAYERFRSTLAQRYGIDGAQTAEAGSLATSIERRFAMDAPSLASDLEACAGAGHLNHLNGRQALKLVQALARYSEAIAQRAEPSHLAIDRGPIDSQHARSDDRPEPEPAIRRSA